MDKTGVMRIATPELYEQNPFYLLRLPVDATSRLIRRRQQDLQGALEMGLAEDEFPNRHHVDSSSVDELFRSLASPQDRLLWAFFWFWPEGNGQEDPLIQNVIMEGYGGSVHSGGTWGGQASLGGREGVRARHNRAIQLHWTALRQEAVLLEQLGQKHVVAVETIQNLDTTWSRCIDYWDQLFESDTFWMMVEEMMLALDDPRVNVDFVHKIRADFPEAFDQINVMLARRYADLGQEEHARRQRRYMDASQQGHDNVKKTLEMEFEPIEAEVNRRIEEAMSGLPHAPESGLRRAQQLFDAVQQPLQSVKALLGQGHTLQKDLFESVALALNACAIAFGNKTEQWQESLDFLNRILPFAVTAKSKEIIENNIRITRENIAETTRRYSPHTPQTRVSPSQSQAQNNQGCLASLFEGLLTAVLVFAIRVVIPLFLLYGCGVVFGKILSACD